MKRKITLIIKISIDISMLILFLLLMGYHLFGEVTHEYLGISLFILFIIHNLLNWRWYKSLFKGKYNLSRIYRLIINFALLIFMILVIISALFISTTAFSFLGIDGGIWARMLHLCSTMWSFILVSMHLGMHMNIFIGMSKKIKLSDKVRIILKWIFRILLLLISLYGLAVFFQRRHYEEMFLLTHFKFFPEETIFKYFLDYISLVCLYAAISYYLLKLLNLKRN